MSISARRPPILPAITFLNLLLAAACGTPTPLPLPTTEGGNGGSAEKGITAGAMGQRDEPLTGTLSIAYPDSTLAQPSAPSPTPYDERAAVRALLPAGAVFDLHDRKHWSGKASDGSRFSAYAVPYRLGDRPSLAAMTQTPPLRLIWDLSAHPELTAEASVVRPIYLHGAEAVFLVVDQRGGALQLVELTDEHASLKDRILLPSTMALDAIERGALQRDHDLTGDGQADLIFSAAGRMAIYQRQIDAGLTLTQDLPWSSQLVVSDEGMLPELIAPEGPGRWSRSQWQGGDYRKVETLHDPALPTPQAVRDGALPPLPGSLTYVLHAERRVLRWPAAGGGLRELGQAPTKDTGLRGLRVSRGSGAALVAIDEGGPTSPVRLLLIDAAGSPHALPTHGELRDFEISDDGAVAVYVGLGVNQRGAALGAAEAEGFKPTDRGAIFAVEQGRPSAARGLASCDAVQAMADWVVGCFGDLALSRDGRQVAFADGKGLHTVGVDGTGLTTVVEPIFVDGPGSRRYSPHAWSPDGHRLSVDVLGYEGLWPALVDLPAGQPRGIAGDWDGRSAGERVWLPDSSGLLVTTEDSYYGDSRTEIRLVSAEDLSSATSLLKTIPVAPVAPDAMGSFAYGPAVAPDGGLRFGTRHPDAAVWQGNGVFSSGPGGADLRRLVTLPPLTGDRGLRDRELLAWSPDGAAFVVRFADGQRLRTLVGLADGSAVWDASALLNEADWLTWSRR